MQVRCIKPDLVVISNRSSEHFHAQLLSQAAASFSHPFHFFWLTSKLEKKQHMGNQDSAGTSRGNVNKTTFPQCNLWLEFPGIFSQNLLCYH